jgi:hypothetical protein
MVPNFFEEKPGESRQGKPAESGDSEDNCGVVSGEEAPNDDGEEYETKGSDRRSGSVYGGGGAASAGAIVASFLFAQFFVFGDECGGGGEDGWEGEEESSDNGAVVLGYEAGGGGYKAPEEKADGVLVRAIGFEGREIGLNDHWRSLAT